MAHQGNPLSAPNVKTEKSNTWVIDSGNPITSGNLLLFHSCKPCTNNHQVKIVVDGTLSPVIGIGTTQISKDLTLKNVLFVPNLSCNLLSIRKMTHDYNCIAKFFPTYYEFQDSNSGRMIGNARKQAGLYLNMLAAEPPLL